MYWAGRQYETACMRAVRESTKKQKVTIGHGGGEERKGARSTDESE